MPARYRLLASLAFFLALRRVRRCRLGAGQGRCLVATTVFSLRTAVIDRRAGASGLATRFADHLFGRGHRYCFYRRGGRGRSNGRRLLHGQWRGKRCRPGFCKGKIKPNCHDHGRCGQKCPGLQSPASGSRFYLALYALPHPRRGRIPAGSGRRGREVLKCLAKQFIQRFEFFFTGHKYNYQVFMEAPL